MSMTMPSGTRSPRARYSFTCRPMVVPSATCLRSRSPLEMWATPTRWAIVTAWVPLPAPGAPISRIRTHASFPAAACRRPLAAAAPPSLPEPVGLPELAQLGQLSDGVDHDEPGELGRRLVDGRTAPLVRPADEDRPHPQRRRLPQVPGMRGHHAHLRCRQAEQLGAAQVDPRVRLVAL